MADLLNIYKILKSRKWVNLSHQIDENSPHFPALPVLEKVDLFTLEDGFHVQKFSVVGQYGTHIDAPIHFVKGGRYLDEIALKDLLLPLYVIDKSKEVAENNDYEIRKQDILDFELEYGKILPGSFVAFRSDWSKRWPSQDKIRNLDDKGVQRTPGWSREALEFLIHERQVKAVGHETLDTDAGLTVAKKGFLYEEYYLLEQNIYQVEVLNNLDKLPAVGALISIAYPNWKEATGSPVRVIAILPEEE
ncbi:MULTISPECIES: cyclase family protein [unclassified Gemella]|uniref:cyclase family protein n=1 Tax=unclassified Gemella TaxID=2624949 RepID=UPI001C043915|nr:MULTISPECIES: cyclase family protein [unclassified Gemella]MBU0278774.1 cyclase family protein [Gemella sp. zg-1178]QWQ38713.1 cyclase family protein [Gemella sp. zg-570]